MKVQLLISLILFAVISMLFNSCAKDTMEAEAYGEIEGIVINGENEEGIATVNITTTPATNAIFTENDGTFTIQNIPTGNYTIQARKQDFSNNSVSVSVRENETAIARIALGPDDDDEENTVTLDDFEAEVTSWFNDAEGDSTFVDVNYRISNTNTTADIDEYEVYFEIETDGNTSFFFDINGENLRSGQSRNGSFRQNIRDNEATGVFIDDLWISE